MTNIRLVLVVTALIMLTGDVPAWRAISPFALKAQPASPDDSRHARIPDGLVFTLAGESQAPASGIEASMNPSEALSLSSKVTPLTGVSSEEVRSAVASGGTIPMWTYTNTATRDGRPYTGMMVGASPFTSPASTTTISTGIIALSFHMSDGGVFDPTAADPCLSAPLTNASDLTAIQQSPIFQNHAYTMNGVDVGVTQYADAYQRGNFWSAIGGQPYHTLLAAAVLGTVTVQVGSGAGVTRPPGSSGRCGNLGLLDGQALDAFIQGTLLPALAPYGVGPTMLPAFVFSNVVLCGQPNLTGCGIGGYHGAVGSPPQTYAVADFDTTGAFGTSNKDTAILSHEIAEWLDDPLGTNPTPAWGGIGQQSACQSNLEVADPLSGTSLPVVVMPNGYGYHLQELAFYSWFFGEPSLGAGGLFSNNGTFTRNAFQCPPGGSGSVPLPAVWRLVGVGDLDGDSKADLVWRNGRTGDVATWFMNGAVVTREPVLAVGVPLAWQIVGVGDLDGDSKTDLVWRQTQTGDVAVWLMNGATVTQGPVIAAGVPLVWQIVAVGDLDGDGRADLVWRQRQTGDVAA